MLNINKLFLIALLALAGCFSAQEEEEPNTEIANHTEIGNDLTKNMTLTTSANGTYITNNQISFNLDFSAPMIVTGFPRLIITVGANTRYAVYNSGSGTQSLRFTYTVINGDNDSNGIEVSTSLDYNGGDISFNSSSGVQSLGTSLPSINTKKILIDTSPPTITSITPPSAGSYKAGRKLNFLANFNEKVNIGGTPRIRLTIGSTTVYANYYSGTGSDKIIFQYTVANGLNDNNGIDMISPIQLNGGTIRDLAGNNAVRTYSVPNTTTVLIDTTAPTLSTQTNFAAGTYTTAQNLDMTLQFNEPMLVTGNPRIALNIGGTTRYAVYQSGSGTNTLTFRHTVQAGDADSDGIDIISTAVDLGSGTITDLALNAPTSLAITNGNLANVLVDTSIPSIISVTLPANNTYTLNQHMDFLVQFSEVVNINTTGGTPSINIDVGGNARQALYHSGTGTDTFLFRYTVQGTDQDNNGIDVTTTLALNGGTIRDQSNFDLAPLTFSVADTSQIRVDGIIPTITNVAPPAQIEYVTNDNYDVVISFSEIVNVTNIPKLDINIGGTTRSASYISGAGSMNLTFRYTIQNNDTDSDGIVYQSPLNILSGTIQDIAGNGADYTFVVPNTNLTTVNVPAPHITAITPPADQVYTNGNTLDFSTTWSENVNITNTPRLALNVGGIVRYALYQSGSGTNTIVWRYTVATPDNDPDGIEISGYIDLNTTGTIIGATTGDNAELTFSAPATPGITIDAVPPTIVSFNLPADDIYGIGETLNFQVIFSETVEVNTTGGTPRLQINLNSGTVYATYQSGSLSNTLLFQYTVVANNLDTDGITLVTPLATNGGTITDLNNNTATLTFVPPTTSGILVDTVGPVIDVVTPPINANYETAEQLEFTFLFDEIVKVTGTPQLSLNFGSGTVQANYLSGNNTDTLTFRYTVQSADFDNAGITMISPIAGGTITDVKGNAATLTYALPNTSGITVNASGETIQAITAPVDGWYKLSDVMTFTFTYTGIVNVTGIPRLPLNIGGNIVHANYSSGSGSTNIVFSYTVTATDLDTNGIDIVSPIDLNGGSMLDSDSNIAELIFTPPNTTGVLVDGIVPTINNIAFTNDYYREGENIDFTVTFSENVTVSNLPRIGLTVGAATRYANYLSGSTSTDLVFRYQVQAGDNDDNGLTMISPIDLNTTGTIIDQATNNATLTYALPNTSNVIVDTTAPSFVSVAIADDNYLTGENLDIAVEFDEAVTFTGGPPRIQITLDSGTVYANYQGGIGTDTLTFRHVIAGGNNDANGIVITTETIDLQGGSLTDLAGNNAPVDFSAVAPDTSAVFVNQDEPTITNVAPPANGNYIVGANLDWIITYDSNVIVDTTGGTPRIQLNIGGNTRYANYQGGSGSNSITFRYTTGTEIDMDGITTVSAAIALNGGDMTNTSATVAADLNIGVINTSGVNVILDNMSLWLDADAASSLTTTGSNVDQWNDKTSNNHHVTSAGGNRPVVIAAGQNGRSTIGFDGINDYLHGNNNFSSRTIFVVFKVTGDQNPAMVGQLWGSYNEATQVAVNPTLGHNGFSFNGAGATTATWSLDDNGSNGPDQESAALDDTYSVGTFQLIDIDFGAGMPITSQTVGNLDNSNPANNAFGGEIAEILIFSDGLSGQERGWILDYLDAKWNLPY